jgi:hypothetical protein
MRINVRFDMQNALQIKAMMALIKIKSHHQPSPARPLETLAARLLQSLLHIHGREHRPSADPACAAAGRIGTVGMPLYYVIWQHFFPQEYESPLLRAGHPAMRPACSRASSAGRC